MDEKLAQASEIMERAIAVHKPSAIIGLFSGGHDSYTVTHFAGPWLTIVAHIDTGIGIPETQQFVIDRCEAHGWPLKIYRAVENVNAKGESDAQIYEDIVVQYGFPGAYGHGRMYARLKERQIRRIFREFKGDGPVMFISGCRKEESTRRMGNTEEIQRFGNQVWVSPFTWMTGSDCAAYMSRYNLPKNPVKERICMSGECLCGAFAKKNELQEIEYWYPEVGKRIRDLEAQVRQAGFPWGWEDQPPSWWSERKKAEKAGQMDAFQKEAETEIQMLCQSCHYRHELA